MQDSVTEPTDGDLLTAWLTSRREASFRTLVTRYAGLVHMAAKRTCGDESMAVEAAQLTFILLARKADSLAKRGSLAGWLHLTAVMQARNLARSRAREVQRHRKLQATMETNDPAGETWRELQGVLDDVLSKLSEQDREALLLRFYRSLSIREIGETLGIATDAAQKRIDRATSRLRDKLMRRGVRTGGTLAGAMAAGFTMDAQAGVAMGPLLATKALATGTAASGFGSSMLVGSAGAKATSAIPMLALVVAGIWLAGQFKSIAKLEEDNASLRKALANGPVASRGTTRPTAVKTPLDRKPVDWEEVAAQINSQGAGGYLSLTMRLEEGFLSMSREELIAALDEIGAASLTSRARDTLENRLGNLLASKDPEYFLRKYIGRLHDGDSSPMRVMLVNALGTWTKQDQNRALTWFDEQIALGTFREKGVPNGFIRLQFERRLFNLLMAQDADAAAKRISAVPPESRIDFYRGESNRTIVNDVSAYVRIAREHLPGKDRINVITWPVSSLGEGGINTYQELDRYFDDHHLVPAERDACIIAISSRGTFPRRSDDLFETCAGDLDDWRAWVAKRSPDLLPRATSFAIRDLRSQMGFPALADIVSDLHARGAGDEVLLQILESPPGAEHKVRALELAGKISDPAKRSEVMKSLGKP